MSSVRNLSHWRQSKNKDLPVPQERHGFTIPEIYIKLEERPSCNMILVKMTTSDLIFATEKIQMSKRPGHEIFKIFPTIFY